MQTPTQETARPQNPTQETAPSQDPIMEITAVCSFSSLSLRDRIDITINAHGFQRFTDPSTSLYLYVSDKTSGDPLMLTGYEGGGPLDTFPATFHGRAGSIAGQGATEFISGHEIRFEVHKGPVVHDSKYEPVLSTTEYITGMSVEPTC